MAVLWMAFLPGRLSRKASAVLADPEQPLIYSVVSLWEIGLKLSRGGYGEFVLPGDWEVQLSEKLAEQGISSLGIHPAHCRLIQDLPFHHKDPFDRMLIAQALVEGLTVVSSDERFDLYEVTRLW